MRLMKSQKKVSEKEVVTRSVDPFENWWQLIRSQVSYGDADSLDLEGIVI